MEKRKRIQALELLALVLLALLLSAGTALERQQQRISDQVIRLHVVANSDSGRDQQIKLRVRDAVLAQAETLIPPGTSRDEALRLLGEELASLEQTANDTLKTQGASQYARVSLARELFDKRDYETFSLPGGYYETLRVSIGAGAGHNWWCVVYPQICTAATSQQRQTVAAMGGMEREQLKILEGETPEYRFKFRSIELVEEFLGWFRRKGER